ncbi:MAG: hypothetical protein UV57_C0059G0001 [Parcubacteria group bacterium GW2011_GWD2_43_10]|uniref:Uncharacterized protein n=2 Tax=Candidatus Vebleniibacteriota TaxID=1817921 RepID=A0A1G2Q8C2_9BACT|nr:MAG: hypothetical protein UV52_C0024G0004 [Parcubacteria group bacterium GW2011_GWD1_42_9]KKS80847.1 MAG: hypothetical protein UV57_C0059G0001 [Parcubacteria group bacterium GW2011_GWD2_43_10]OHA54437.1 MAG: hypothetical protein A2388_03080 [Candidatus Veblenbacteria bacterium RIFOXYB1_FULL_43_13]OHA56748.1 MAG: hypothetical protein A2588_03125 [Candidatus Veblenbacteria bacterium RIFOXYD1_FULL_43_11]HBZ36540.1 hypothetical protein [Candidatus Veblenbacteria bacterium]
MSKKHKTYYLPGDDEPFMNPDGEVYEPRVLKSLIIRALNNKLKSSARIAITVLRWSKKLDEAEQPISESVVKVVTLTTLQRWYRSSTGESLTKKTLKKEREEFQPLPD